MNLEEAKKIIIQSYKVLVDKGVVPENSEELKSAVNFCLKSLNRGDVRIAEPDENLNKWVVNEYLKQAILLYFRMNNNKLLNFEHYTCWDKVPLKTHDWTGADFEKAGIRLVPGSVVRYGSFIGKSAVIMPSFINMGAYVGSSTMVDTWATIGSCAQIGQNCHISDGVTIGGVLEPVQASPVIVEDNCFIGARSSISEGVRVGKGSVIASGVSLSASTKIVDRETGGVSYGIVPPYSVVVSGSMLSPSEKIDNISVYCAVIVKKVDESTRAKTSINELLR